MLRDNLRPLWGGRWRTRDDLTYAIDYWIEHTHNHRRRQCGLGKLTPVEFEPAFTARREDAATRSMNTGDNRTDSRPSTRPIGRR
jgi:hypothetical protein